MSAGAQTAAAPAPAPAPERRVVRQVAPGVQHLQILRENADAPLAANILRLNPAQAGWRLQVWPGADVLLTPDAAKGREAVGRMAVRRGALAALNGDFFPFTGDPIGLQVTDGELYSDPYPGRSAFGITREGRALWGPVGFQGKVTIGERSFPIHGVNRARKADELILYTPRYGAKTGTNAAGTEALVEWLEGSLAPGKDVTGTLSETFASRGDSAVPPQGMVLSGHGAAAKFLQEANTGDGVRLRVDLSGEEGQSWNDAWQAIGGGPRLLKRGQIVVGPGAEGFRSDVLNGTAPRSAVAMTAAGELLLVAVDGRQAVSAGMALASLAKWLQAEGAVDAINLDGGGSTTLSLRQLVVNSPSDGTQRLVANALLLFVDAPPAAADEEIAVRPISAPAVADASVQPAPGAPAAAAAPVQPAAGAPTAPAPEAAFALVPGAAAAMSAPLSLQAGTRIQFRAVRRGDDGAWQEVPDDAVTWGMEGRLGRLSQEGDLLGMTAGAGAVSVSTGLRVARLPVVVTPGAPARLTNALEPVGDGTAWVRARVVDAYGNNVPGVEVRLTYATAEGEQSATRATDEKGQTRLQLPLNLLAPGTPVTVSVAGMEPVAVKLPAPAPGATPPAPAPAPVIDEPVEGEGVDG